MAAYDMEKYREKREKVLGVRRRGISFGTVAVIVSSVILLGLGAVVLPKAVGYWQSRNLDDAIYKVQQNSELPADLIFDLAAVQGVKDVTVEADKGRIVVPFDTMTMDTDRIEAYFQKKNLKVVLLNRMGHGHRLASAEKEKQFGG